MSAPTRVHEEVRANVPSNPADASPRVAEEYVAPKVVVLDADEFVRSLGPAQACSPAPF